MMLVTVDTLAKLTQSMSTTDCLMVRRLAIVFLDKVFKNNGTTRNIITDRASIFNLDLTIHDGISRD